NLLVNPYTGKIQGNAQTPTAKFFATVLQLHRWLLIENHDIGGAITGTAALGMILLQITGLLLWLPAKISSWKKWNVWKPGFKIKTDASSKRLNFDLHKTLGFYAFVFVTIMALTGPVFAWEWYRTGYRQLMGVFTPREEKALETEANGRQPLALEEIIRQSNQVFSYSGVLRLTLPKDSVGTIVAQKSQNGFFTSAGVDRLTLDPYTGQVLKLERFADKTLGEKIAVSAKIIHTGELYGTFTKILYFLACLIATSLPVTGFLIWWKRGKPEAAKPVARPAGTARVRPRAVVQAVRE
uniref:PepSY-associated TM helix domain-containing protein n=1 Tax=Siphonobacter sp. TaxID=1869184 RepID=UPI003B3AB395